MLLHLWKAERDQSLAQVQRQYDNRGAWCSWAALQVSRSPCQPRQPLTARVGTQAVKKTTMHIVLFDETYSRAVRD